MQPSGRRLYDEVWTVASNMIKHNSKYQQPNCRWWERKDWQMNIDKPIIFKPFVLKVVSRNGQQCSRCHWSEGCAGCVI